MNMTGIAKFCMGLDVDIKPQPQSCNLIKISPNGSCAAFVKTAI